MTLFRRRLALFRVSGGDGTPRANFIDKLSDADETILVKIWKDVRGQKKKALKEPSGFGDFWKEVYEGGRKKLPNPNPDSKKSHPQVTANTLLKSSKPFRDKVFKEFEEWRSKGRVKKKPPPRPKTALRLSPDRYTSTTFEVTRGADERLKSYSMTPRAVADLCGLGLAPKEDRSVTITTFGDHGVEISVDYDLPGGGRVEMVRLINFKEKTIKNDTLILKKAPKGTGTKMFASQIREAQAKGFRKITCDALTKPPDWVGTLVWPRLGYDGDLPSPSHYKANDPDTMGWPSSTYDEAAEILKDEGFKEPFKISMLMQSEKGRSFWEEHTPRWVRHLSFDLGKDSQSSTVLQAYLEAKGLA